MTPFFDGLLRFIDRATLFGAWGAIAAIFLGFWIIIIDILMRVLVGSSLSFGLEYSGYLVAFSFFWGTGWTLQHGGHIRVDLVTQKIGSKGARRVDILATFMAMAMTGLLSWAMIDWAIGSASLDAKSFYPSATPLFWPQILLAAGPVLLNLALVARLIRLLRGEEL